ncbi:hypothetical protein Adi01nite_79900 [Amorphoplanes digitatis]|nr:hypothetical protein GCM10020092_081250 [Actinoplanes digitatis]GID98578.1 hypothetical protein Adi01nite_79900 [Actinoplanes digitatis]
MRGIYDRVSTGVDNDVSHSEARFLFLETYTILGEILSINDGVREEVTAKAREVVTVQTATALDPAAPEQMEQTD